MAGYGRIAQTNAASIEYFLGDALGSVRQLTDAQGQITLAKAYDPYGVVSMSAGAGQSSYGYTSEYQDSYNDLVYLRARHYAPAMGRFLSRDTWSGDENQPLSFNLWNYAYSNPVNLTDPTGNFPAECLEASNFAQCLREWISESRDDCAESSGWKPLGNFNLSSYYITDESQYYSKGSASRPVPSLGGESFNKYFLFSNAGVCMQGTGKTRGGDYISCTSHMQWVQDTDDDTPGCANKVRNGDKSMCPWRYFMPPDMPAERENKPFSFRAGLPDFVIPFETVAIGNNVPLTAHDGTIEIRIMSKILTDLFHNYPPASNSDNILTVTDVGRGLNGIDIYLGEQPTSREDPTNSFVQRFANKIQDIPDTFIEWRYKK